MFDLINAKENVKKIVEVFDGKVDCFINNIEIYNHFKHNNCSIEDWTKIINTDLKKYYFTVREILTQCIEKNANSNIVIISPIEQIKFTYGIEYYEIINIALNQLTKILAKRLLDRKIRINVIIPGVTYSNKDKSDKKKNLYSEFLQGRRILLTKEITDIVVFLISDFSKCITGQVIYCDNGETL